MQGRKVILPVLTLLSVVSSAFCQTEMLKSVANNLAFYRQKKDLKYLSNAKKSVDSLITDHADSVDLQKTVYRALVNSTILNIDTLNKLNQPANFLKQTTDLVDKLSAQNKIYKYQNEIGYSKRCLANVYIRKAFVYVNSSDFISALKLFGQAKKYAPDFKQLNAYIAYSNNKLGNLHAAAKYYTNLVDSGDAKVEYIETASNIYQSIGDTVTALNLVKKGRKLLPDDKSLLLDEANMYSNRGDFKSLAPLLPQLLEITTDKADIAFVAGNCLDHLNQYDKAASLYLRSIELNGTVYGPVFNLGLLYFKQSELKPDKDKAQNISFAVQWLQKANEISPTDIRCLDVLKLLYAETGNQDQINRVNNQLKQLTNQ